VVVIVVEKELRRPLFKEYQRIKIVGSCAEADILPKKGLKNRGYKVQNRVL